MLQWREHRTLWWTGCEERAFRICPLASGRRVARRALLDLLCSETSESMTAAEVDDGAKRGGINSLA